MALSGEQVVMRDEEDGAMDDTVHIVGEALCSGSRSQQARDGRMERSSCGGWGTGERCCLESRAAGAPSGAAATRTAARSHRWW